MTREEAKQIISDIDKAYRNFTADEYKAFEMAIQALSQEPTKREIEREYLFQSLCEDFKKLQAENDDLRKRLEQEPCDDAISQNQSNACSILDDECPYPHKHCWECSLNYQYELAKHELDKNVELPSVTQKSGKWIYRRGDKYSCSKCGTTTSVDEAGIDEKPMYKFCPYCGAKMESEDK